MSTTERGMREFMAQEMARREAIRSSIGQPLARALVEVSSNEQYRGLMVGFQAAVNHAVQFPWYRTRYIDLGGGAAMAVQNALVGFPPSDRGREKYTQIAEVAAMAPIQDPQAYEQFTRGVAESATKVIADDVVMLTFKDKLKPGSAQPSDDIVRDRLVDSIRMYIGHTYETACFDPIP